MGKVLITFRATEQERDYIQEEAAKLREETGFNVSMSDVIRRGLLAYEESKKQNTLRIKKNTATSKKFKATKS